MTTSNPGSPESRRSFGWRAPHVAVLLGAVSIAFAGACSGDDSPATTDAGAAVTEPTIWLESSSSLDPTALPLGDQHYVTDAPKQGYVYVCDARMFQQTGAPGSQQDGDWIKPAAGTYDVTKKPFVQGNVHYSDAEFTITTTEDQRVIDGNGLPLGVPTGIFPVQASDPAYTYDPNPNEVTSQDISFSIPHNPTVAKSASCTYKEVGITLDGVPLHGPLDSTGRDELAHELQDVCTGAPQPGGGYHRHALSECMPHIHERNALVGYALDGFGIFSPYDENGDELTSADLDECHGMTSEIVWEGKKVSMYHYVMTRDYPYTVACFKGTPTRNAFPPLPGAPPQQLK
ncbi:MAG TPA: YHYH protein [Solirubrobacterales bacterium]|nr:YHYH protein [Solirubrobacterales bacterium]